MHFRVDVKWFALVPGKFRSLFERSRGHSKPLRACSKPLEASTEAKPVEASSTDSRTLEASTESAIDAAPGTLEEGWEEG